MENSPLIRWTVFLFAGGDVGIAGALILLAVVVRTHFPRRDRTLRPFLVFLGLFIGWVLMLLGSLTVPIWFVVVTIIWLLVVFVRWKPRKTTTSTEPNPGPENQVRRRRILAACSCVWLFVLTAFELPVRVPRLAPQPISTVMVIGDSVTAGLNDGEDTWPRQLARAVQVDVLDASQPGATLRSARQQNSLLGGNVGLLIIEIGGNDLLEGLPVATFESQLDQLLADAVQSQRTVVMFELPLPPLCAAYGLAQRRQAARHGATLVPKRRFAEILTTSGATVDGIHLSVAGQSQMMRLIQSFLGNRLQSGQGTYQHFERKFNVS